MLPVFLVNKDLYITINISHVAHFKSSSFRNAPLRTVLPPMSLWAKLFLSNG
jgi:hypothetical protein